MREKFYLFQLEYGCQVRQDNHDDYLFIIISDTSKNWGKIVGFCGYHQIAKNGSES